MPKNMKLHVEVCIDFRRRQVHVNTFSDNGKKTYEGVFNNVEYVEFSGTSRILVGERMSGDIVCINLESDNARIVQQGLVLKIG